jgi:hypothetical protein
MWARTSGLASSQLLISSRTELDVGLVPWAEDPRMSTIPAVVVGDVGEVADPAVQFQQVERRSTKEIDRHLVGTEEVTHLGDVSQWAAETVGSRCVWRISADGGVRSSRYPHGGSRCDVGLPSKGVVSLMVASPLLIVTEVSVMVPDGALRDRRRPLAKQRLQRIPPRPLAKILALARDGAQGLQDHSIRQCRCDIGVVVWRADLDHIHPDHRKLETDPAHRVKQLACGQSARFRCASARCVSWIADVDVD